MSYNSKSITLKTNAIYTYDEIFDKTAFDGEKTKLKHDALDGLLGGFNPYRSEYNINFSEIESIQDAFDDIVCQMKEYLKNNKKGK